MPLITDWTTDTAQSNATVSIQHHTSSPLDGNRSVRFNVTTGGVSGTKGAGAAFLFTPAHTRGFVMGRLQTLMRVDSDVIQGGIFFVASQDVGIAGAGSCYLFGPTGTLNSLELRKVNSGIFDDTPTTLDTAGINVGSSPTSSFALEVEWKADLGIFGGTFITCRYGPTLGSMVDVLEFVDESSPLLTSFAEGLFVFRSGISTVGQVIFDDTTVYQITT